MYNNRLGFTTNCEALNYVLKVLS